MEQSETLKPCKMIAMIRNHISHYENNFFHFQQKLNECVFNYSIFKTKRVKLSIIALKKLL